MFSTEVDAQQNPLTPFEPRTDSSSVSAVSFVRKMRGGSQSSLLKASDGKLYIVKFNGGPQGTNVLANEALGSMLAQQLGLPVALHTAIHVSDEFLDSNPEVWFEMQSGRERPASGLHYASALVQADEYASVYEILPRSWFGRIVNRSDFLGILLFDIWCNNTDNRQAIFIESPGDRSLKAVFIDHGHMFGGPNGQSEARPGAAQFLDSHIYDELFSEQRVADWMRKIWAVTAGTVYTTASTIPVEWSSAPLADTISKLFKRRDKLSELISQGDFLRARGIGYQKCNHAANKSVRVHSDRVHQSLGSRDQLSLSVA